MSRELITFRTDERDWDFVRYDTYCWSIVMNSDGEEINRKVPHEVINQIIRRYFSGVYFRIEVKKKLFRILGI